MNRFIRNLYRFFINIVAVLYLVFDEVFIYVSDKLEKILDLIPSIENIRNYLVDRICNMNKYIVLFILLSFLVSSELLGILSFTMLSKGLMIPFIALYIFKFLPFFVMNFIFKYAKDELLTIGWFSFCYFKFVNFVNYLKQTEIVQKTKELKDYLKTKVKYKNETF